MRWVHPELIGLCWLVVAALVVLAVLAWRARKQAMARFGDIALIEQLSASRDLRRRRWKAGLTVAAAGLVVVSLARPQFGGTLTMTRRRGVDVMVALDVSQSMLAEDMKPNRLAAAKREITSLLDRLVGKRITGFLTASTVPKGEDKGVKITVSDNRDKAKRKTHRQFVFWKKGADLFARDLKSKFRDAYKLDNILKDALPWDKDFLFTPTEKAPAPKAGK